MDSPQLSSPQQTLSFEEQLQRQQTLANELKKKIQALNFFKEEDRIIEEQLKKEYRQSIFPARIEETAMICQNGTDIIYQIAENVRPADEEGNVFISFNKTKPNIGQINAIVNYKQESEEDPGFQLGETLIGINPLDNLTLLPDGRKIGYNYDTLAGSLGQIVCDPNIVCTCSFKDTGESVQSRPDPLKILLT